jgi:hypothetical protein
MMEEADSDGSSMPWEVIVDHNSTLRAWDHPSAALLIKAGSDEIDASGKPNPTIIK